MYYRRELSNMYKVVQYACIKAVYKTIKLQLHDSLFRGDASVYKEKNIRHKITDQEITFTKVAYEFVGM